MAGCIRVAFEFSSFLNIDLSVHFLFKSFHLHFLWKKNVINFSENSTKMLQKNASIINEGLRRGNKSFQAQFSVSKGVSKGLWYLRLMALLRMACGSKVTWGQIRNLVCIIAKQFIKPLD